MDHLLSNSKWRVGAIFHWCVHTTLIACSARRVPSIVFTAALASMHTICTMTGYTAPTGQKQWFVHTV